MSGLQVALVATASTLGYLFICACAARAAYWTVEDKFDRGPAAALAALFVKRGDTRTPRLTRAQRRDLEYHQRLAQIQRDGAAAERAIGLAKEFRVFSNRDAS